MLPVEEDEVDAGRGQRFGGNTRANAGREPIYRFSVSQLRECSVLHVPSLSSGLHGPKRLRKPEAPCVGHQLFPRGFVDLAALDLPSFALAELKISRHDHFGESLGRRCRAHAIRLVGDRRPELIQRTESARIEDDDDGAIAAVALEEPFRRGPGESATQQVRQQS